MAPEKMPQQGTSNEYPQHVSWRNNLWQVNSLFLNCFLQFAKNAFKKKEINIIL